MPSCKLIYATTMEPHFYFRFEFDPNLVRYTEFVYDGHAWHYFYQEKGSCITLDVKTGHIHSLVLFNLHEKIIIVDEHQRAGKLNRRQFIILTHSTSYLVKLAGISSLLFIATPYIVLSSPSTYLIPHWQAYHLPGQISRIIKEILISSLTGPVLEIKIKSAIAEISHYLNESIEAANRLWESDFTSNAKAKLVLAYILNHIADPHLGGVNELASRFYINRGSLSKAFKKLTSFTIPAFIRHKKIEYACKLLVTTEMLVEDIAEATGFSDTANFIRCFRSVIHTTPKRYRLKHKDNQN